MSALSLSLKPPSLTRAATKLQRLRFLSTAVRRPQQQRAPEGPDAVSFARGLFHGRLQSGQVGGRERNWMAAGGWRREDGKGCGAWR